MKKTRSLRLVTLIFMGGMVAAAVLLADPACAQTAADPITEMNVFGRGEGLQTNASAKVAAVTGSVNAIPATINAIPTAFSMSNTVLRGDPGTVTITYNIVTYTDPKNPSNQTITFTNTTATGNVTVTGTDSSGGKVFGENAKLKVNNQAVIAKTSAGSFTVAASGNPKDRMIRSCVAFTSGLNVCIDIFSLSRPKKAELTSVVKTWETVRTFSGTLNTLAANFSFISRAEAATLDGDPALWPNAQPNGPGGAANGNGGTGTLSGANYSDAIQMFADQMANIMIYQLPIIGEMLDAKHQLETQRIFGAVAAQAFREYQPSEQVCAFGTLARSTAPSRFKVDDNIGAIDLILQKRETLNANQASAWGPSADQNVRLDKYKSVYCDPNDNAGEIEKAAICTTTGSGLRRNKDIDWRRTVEANMTMDVDFTDGAITEDEEDVLSLAKNLYASDVVTPIPETAIAPYGTYRELQDSRMLSAIRSVERYSYASIVAAKARGSGLNATQLRQVLQNLGVPAADVTQLVGENPSYFTQMDFFTQKMFQDPGFYTGLYTSPANVARMKVVLQAIRLMADRDRFEQSLRREMLVSLILEMRLRAVQEGTTNTTNDVRAKSR